MPLSAGTGLGPYEILAPLGAGGMGEVYRARDTRLDRTVAIKILPESFAADRERLDRFQQEAKILSALNHPNLLAIFDVGSQNGLYYLVSEFLEGKTLRELLEEGTLPPRRINEYSLQITRGLAAAHDKGIIHRDLKPENIFVLRDERVKILDFGLAKQAAVAAAADATMTSPNRTLAGTVLGTAGYMSPEQVRGEAVDHRSDLFSFGTVLYEMVAGQRAFRGDSGIEVMNSILKQEPPDVAESGTQVSPGIQRIVQRCLEKKPEARFQSASDLAFALDSLSSVGSSAAGLRAIKDTQKSRSRLLFAVSVVAALAIGVIATLLLHHPAVSQPVFTQITFRSAFIRHARFAPDGHMVVYDSRTGGKPTQLFSTRTDTIEAQSLNTPASVLSVSSTGELAVSLDTRFDLKFTPTGRLARAPLGGGSTRELLEDVTDADWAPNGSALAVSRKVGRQFHLEYPIGKLLYQTNGYVSDLRFSPAGDQIAFADHPILGDDRGVVAIIDLKGTRRVLTREFGSLQGIAWAPRGNEIWFTSAVNVEPNSLRAVDLKGNERVLLAAPIRLHLHDVLKDGSVLISSEDFRDQTLFADTGKGEARNISAFPFQITASLSRDGITVLLNSFVTGPNSDYNLYTQRTDGTSPVLIGQGGALGLSSDGKWAAALDPAHVEHIRIIPTGIGESKTVDAPPGQVYLGAAWMPDSKSLLVVTAGGGHGPATYVQDIKSGTVRQITSEGKYTVTFDQVSMNVSPDGNHCVITDGDNHFWVQPLDGGQPREITGLLEHDYPLQWHDGPQSIFFERPGEAGDVDIYDLNLATGQQKLWVHFSPPEKTALLSLRHTLITPDGAHYLSTAQRIYSTLFLAQGIQ